MPAAATAFAGPLDALAAADGHAAGVSSYDGGLREGESGCLRSWHLLLNNRQDGGHKKAWCRGNTGVHVGFAF